MSKNFDKVIDRSSTPSYKWDKKFLKNSFGNPDVIPLWIADMDFEVSRSIQDALHQKVEFGVFGYEFKAESQINSIIDWYSKYHNWQIDDRSVKFVPSVLTGISIAINQLTDEEDRIIIQPPVYYPFANIIKSSKREVIENSLKFEDGRYSIDFDDLEIKAKDPKTKVILISNPHNPVGRVWTRDELERMGEIALEYDLIILSDDIHADIVYKEYTYTSMASISDEIAHQTVTFLSPGKTFNVSGISTAVIVASNEEYGKAIDEFTNRYHIGAVPNSLSIVAFEAGYAQSRQWFVEVMEYIRSNLDFMKSYIESNIKQVKVVEPEGTYLVWLDLRALNQKPKELQKYLVNKANLGLDYGHWFGSEGAGFARINIAASRVLLKKAMERLKDAVENLER